MAQAKPPTEIDILALIAEVHGGSPEDVRQERVTAALNTLEVTHRGAAQALRDVATSGLRRNAGAQKVLPQQAISGVAAHASKGPIVADSAPPAAASAPENQPQVQSGEGADVHMDHRTLTHIVRPNRGR